MEYPKKRKRRLPVHIEVRINNMYSAEGLDMSEDGMYVYSRHKFIPDSVIELAMSINGETTTLSARVAHVQPGVGFGVSFPDIPDEVVGLFREVLKEALEGAEED